MIRPNWKIILDRLLDGDIVDINQSTYCYLTKDQQFDHEQMTYQALQHGVYRQCDVYCAGIKTGTRWIWQYDDIGSIRSLCQTASEEDVIIMITNATLRSVYGSKRK